MPPHQGLNCMAIRAVPWSDTWVGTDNCSPHFWSYRTQTRLLQLPEGVARDPSLLQALQL